MSSTALPALNLETQNISVALQAGSAQQEETIESSQVVSKQDNSGLFIPGVNVPKLKKYYQKLKRNIVISVMVSQFILLGALWFIFTESCNLWGAEFAKKFSASALESLKSQGPWVQTPISVGFGSFLIGLTKNLFRLLAQKRRITWECDLCKSGRYPTSITPALSQKIMSLFGWRINGFWVGFTITGLGIIAGVYGYLIRGFHSSVWEVTWEKIKSKSFEWNGGSIGKKVCQVAACVGAFGFLIVLITNPLSRFAIRSALSIFDSNELNMCPSIRERVFRLNKRDKIISTVILCVLGLAIFIILKRLIIAVFNRSFNVSKW